MTQRQRLIYALVMTCAVFFTAVVLGVGTAVVNLVFAVAMGAFAYLAVGVAGRLADRTKK